MVAFDPIVENVANLYADLERGYRLESHSQQIGEILPRAAPYMFSEGERTEYQRREAARRLELRACAHSTSLAAMTLIEAVSYFSDDRELQKRISTVAMTVLDRLKDAYSLDFVALDKNDDEVSLKAYFKDQRSVPNIFIHLYSDYFDEFPTLITRARAYGIVRDDKDRNDPKNIAAKERFFGGQGANVKGPKPDRPRYTPKAIRKTLNISRETLRKLAVACLEKNERPGQGKRNFQYSEKSYFKILDLAAQSPDADTRQRALAESKRLGRNPPTNPN